MRRLLRSTQAQAMVELVLVFFLFVLFSMGIAQFVMLGSAKIRCEIAARRAAWHVSTFNHLDFSTARAEINVLIPGFKVESMAGNRTQAGKTTVLSCQVPALGYFRFFKPEGFKVTATSAVIAYNEAPIASRLIQQGFRSFEELRKKIR